MLSWVDALRQEVDRLHLHAGDRAADAHLRGRDRDAHLRADRADSTNGTHSTRRTDRTHSTHSTRREREQREGARPGRQRVINSGDPAPPRPRPDVTCARAAADRSPHRTAAAPSAARDGASLDAQRGNVRGAKGVGGGARQPAGASALKTAAGTSTRRGAAGDASAPPAEEELCITVARGKRPLGLVLNAQNLVTEVSPGGPADGRLQVGDRLVEIDGVALRGRQAHAVLTPAPSHTFRVRRRNAHAPAGPWA